MPLFLGPLGRLARLRAPRPDIRIEYPRQGGTHVALSGARTVDYLGSRGQFEFSWKWLGDDERDYLEALRDRHIRGPLRFVLTGWRRNRLSRSAAALGYGGRDSSGVSLTAGTTAPSPDWPDPVPLAGTALVWSGWAPDSELRLDHPHPVPVLPGEAVTGSVWVRSPHAVAVQLAADHHTADGVTAATEAAPVTLTPGTWRQLTVTVPPTGGLWGVSLRITPTSTPAATSLLLAAAQAEPGDTATGWSPGGGAPVVMVDELPLTAARRGFTHPTLTLLEA